MITLDTVLESLKKLVQEDLECPSLEPCATSDNNSIKENIQGCNLDEVGTVRSNYQETIKDETTRTDRIVSNREILYLNVKIFPC